MSTDLLIDETEESSPGLCPCCHARQAVPGLFGRVKVTNWPAVFGILMNQPSTYIVNKINEDIWRILGRWFIQSYAGMPIGHRESPIRITTWIEVDELTAMRVLEAMEGHGEAVESECRLAADLPGFPGTIGAKGTFQIFQGDLPELIEVSDERMNAIPKDLTHDQMAALYRLIWGNPTPVDDADLELRAAVNRHWHDHIGRPFFRRAVTPPPYLAGIRAPELLISPPVDTNEPALLATVGCSEHPDSNGELIEVVAELRDPSEELIDSFSAFSWFSRTGSSFFGAGAIVIPHEGLPGAKEEMVGWFLRDPQVLPEHAWRLDHAGKEIRIVEAVPIDKYEAAFAQLEDADSLASMLELVDTTDLNRESVSPLAGR